MARGNPAAAEKLIDAARNLKDGGRDNVGPMLWKALALFRRGQIAEALQWYKRALRTHPKAPACVRLGIGACQLKLGDYSAARAAFQRVVDLEGENPDALLGLALAELDAASPFPPELLHADDDDADADEQGTVSERLEAAGDAYAASVDRGLKLLERAFNADPANAATTAALARHYLFAGDGGSVEALTESLVSGTAGGATPRLRAEAAFARGRVHHDKGDLARAQALYATASQLDDSFAAPALGLAQVALARGDPKSAMTYAERAYAAFPNSVPVTRIYGHLRRAADAAASLSGGGGLVSAGSRGAGAGRDAETAAVLKKAVDADPSDTEARLEYGDALLGAGDYAGALAAYETAAKLARRDGKGGKTGGAPPAALLNNCAVLRAMTSAGDADGLKKARETFLEALETAAAEDGVDGASGEALDAPEARKKTPAGALPVAFNLARLAEDGGDTADADARYSDLLAAAPDMTECLLRRAATRASRGDFAAAMELAKRALETRPDDVDAMACVGHLLMREGKWAEAQAQFKALRETPKKLSAQAAALAAAAGKDPNAVTHQHDEYAMVSLANAAYYRAVKTQNSSKFKSGDQASRQMEKEHLEHAQTMYTKALQKSGSNLFAANGLGILLADKGKIDEAKTTFQLIAEGITAAAEATGGDRDRLATSPDISINQGHIQMAKGNFVAAARHYEQAQSQFYHNMNDRVMLFQARNFYEAGDIQAAKETLRRAMHVAPWDHRLRQNLAYMYQESGNRMFIKLSQKMKSKSKGDKGKSVNVEESGRLEQVLTAVSDFTTARNLFVQLQNAFAKAKAAGPEEVHKLELLGIERRKLEIHVQFCEQQIGYSDAYRKEAEREEKALQERREKQAEARRLAEEERAAEAAAKAAKEALQRSAEEAAAAAAAEKFKQSQAEYLKRAAGERDIEEAAEGARGKKGKASKNVDRYDDDDDDEVLPEENLKPQTEEQKAALKASGLFSDSEDEEEPEAEDTDNDADDDDANVKAAADDGDEEMEEEKEDEEAPSGRRGRKKPAAKQEKDDKAKKAMDALAAKSRKKRGLDAETPAEEKETVAEEEAAEEGGGKRRRKALIDDEEEDE